jgi:hypothetical protein
MFLDGNVFDFASFGSGAGVAGSDENTFGSRTLCQFPRQSMFTPPGTHYEYVHDDKWLMKYNDATSKSIIFYVPSPFGQ